MKEQMIDFFIHKSSYIDDQVNIGSGSKIWHFCHILKETNIGDNCVVGQNCSIGPNVNVGNGVKIQNGVSLYDGVIVEDDVFIGPCAVFTNILNPRAFINRKSEFKKTLLKKGCSIGANATVICGNSLGRYSFVGSGAVVNRDVKDYELVVGVPIKHLGFVSKEGTRLEFNSDNIAYENGIKYILKDGFVKEVL